MEGGRGSAVLLRIQGYMGELTLPGHQVWEPEHFLLGSGLLGGLRSGGKDINCESKTRVSAR